MTMSCHVVDGPFVTAINRLAHRQRQKHYERASYNQSGGPPPGTPGYTRIISVSKLK
jgi:hypothetical protein